MLFKPIAVLKIESTTAIFTKLLTIRKAKASKPRPTSINMERTGLGPKDSGDVAVTGEMRCEPAELTASNNIFEPPTGAVFFNLSAMSSVLSSLSCRDIHFCQNTLCASPSLFANPSLIVNPSLSPDSANSAILSICGRLFVQSLNIVCFVLCYFFCSIYGSLLLSTFSEARSSDLSRDVSRSFLSPVL